MAAAFETEVNKYFAEREQPRVGQQTPTLRAEFGIGFIFQVAEEFGRSALWRGRVTAV